MPEKKCPFCDLAPSRVYLANEVALAIPDAFPITQGHTLVVPKRHVASLFDLSEEDGRDLPVAQVRAKPGTTWPRRSTSVPTTARRQARR